MSSYTKHSVRNNSHFPICSSEYQSNMILWKNKQVPIIYDFGEK